MSSLETLHRQRNVLQQLQELQAHWSSEKRTLISAFEDEKQEWAEQRAYLERQVAAMTAAFKEAAVARLKAEKALEETTANLKESEAIVALRSSVNGGSFEGLNWSDLRWATAKLLSPGSSFLPVKSFIHCVVSIVVCFALACVLGVVANPAPLKTLQPWSMTSVVNTLDHSLWPLTLDNVLHVHAPVTIIGVLGVQLAINRKRLRLTLMQLVKCAGSSVCFFVVLAWWLATTSDTELGYVDAALAILDTPALWLVILLPPPALHSLRLLNFPRLVMSGSRAMTIGSKVVGGVLWLLNAILIAISTMVCTLVMCNMSEPSAVRTMLGHALVLGHAPSIPWWASATTVAYYHVPIIISISMAVMRLALLLAGREHPMACLQHVVLDAVFLGVLTWWIVRVLAVDLPVLQLITTPLLICCALCLSRMLVAFHLNFWRESVQIGDNAAD